MAEAKIGLVLDCADPEALSAFWVEALGMERVGAAGSYVMLLDTSGSLPKLLLQRVEESKGGKNRMHLDIETPDVEKEASRLESLGARRLEPEPRDEHGSHWVVMAEGTSSAYATRVVSDRFGDGPGGVDTDIG